jgi:hypothetical protein
VAWDSDARQNTPAAGQVEAQGQANVLAPQAQEELNTGGQANSNWREEDHL